MQLVKGKKLFLYDDFHRAYKGVKKPVLDVRRIQIIKGKEVILKFNKFRHISNSSLYKKYEK